MAEHLELHQYRKIYMQDKILLNLVRRGNDQKLRDFLSKCPNDVNLILGPPYNKPVLFACCLDLANEVKHSIIKTLIELGAHLYHSDFDLKNVKKQNYRDKTKDAIHYASLGQNPQILQTIVNFVASDKINSLSNGKTALNLLISEGIPQTRFLDCIKILIRSGVDATIPDTKNFFPIFWAEKKGYTDVVNVIAQTTSMDFKKSSNIDLRLNYPIDVLFGYLEDNKEENFISYNCLDDYVNSDNGKSTLLQMAVEKNLKKVVEALLSKGADVNKTTLKNTVTPFELAAESGFYEIVELILMLRNDQIWIPPISPIVLIKILKNINYENVNANVNYNSCALLLEQFCKFEVNILDQNRKTPLHYAAKYGDSDVILELLRRGASMACQNDCGDLAIEDVDAHLLKTHLDECLEANIEHSIDKENFLASYNYKTLMPPASVQYDGSVEEVIEDVEASNSILITQHIKHLTSETVVLSCMAESKELRHLLVHPVITSFLYMKWHRIRWFFYTNAVFYFTFCLSLIAYILIVYDEKNDNQSSIYSFLSISLWTTYIMLVIRESIQLIVSPKIYFTANLENWYEIILIAFTAFILLNQNMSEFVKRQVLSIAILLVAFELVILIGQHPKLSTNMVMLRTVSLNFFKFLAWYSILIVAFALSFFTLFRENNVNKSIGEVGEKEQNVFVNPLSALFKTIVMLTGEFDADSISFNIYPITSHIIFMLFVFMIAIILFNLLNGLAVSDTQMIMKNSELLSLISLIDYIVYLESIFVSDKLPEHVFQKLAYYCCLPLSLRAKLTGPGVFIKRIMLFPHYLKQYKLTVYPNQQGKVFMEEDEYRGLKHSNCISNFHYIYLDKKTAKRTKQIIRDRKENAERESKDSARAQEQLKIIIRQQNTIDKLEKEQEKILSKLDYIITNLKKSSRKPLYRRLRRYR